MIDAVNHLRFEILAPFILGAVIGIVPFSHFLSWLLKHFRNATIAILTGFILGSLGTLWPWKESIIETFGDKKVITGFEWHLPQMDAAFAIAVAYCIFGICTIYIIERLARNIIAGKRA
jgi:putative membrane protein